MPESVTIPAGATSATFPITTFAVPTDVEAAISVVAGSVEQRGLLHIKPQLPTLTSLTINSPVAGGSEATGTLTFSAPLPHIRWPAGGHGVRIRLSDPSVGGVISGGEWIAPGVTTHTFRMYTQGLPTTQTFTVTAALDRTTLSAPLTITAAPPISLSSVTLQPATVNGGEGGIGRDQPRGRAVHGRPGDPDERHAGRRKPSGDDHDLSGRDELDVRVYDGAALDGSQRPAHRRFGSASASGVLTVNPSVSVAKIPIASLTLNPATIAGGGTSTGTATLETSRSSGRGDRLARLV